MNDGAPRVPRLLLQAAVARDGDSATVVLVGELDLSTLDIAERALQPLRADGTRRLVVDLRRLDFIGSTGLRLLFELREGWQADGRQLVLVKGSNPIDRLVELAGVEDQLPFVTDESDIGALPGWTTPAS